MSSRIICPRGICWVFAGTLAAGLLLSGSAQATTWRKGYVGRTRSIVRSQLRSQGKYGVKKVRIRSSKLGIVTQGRGHFLRRLVRFHTPAYKGEFIT